jgi:hypothetical protein
MEHHLVFDLETIPQQKPMTDAQNEQFIKKMKSEYNGTLFESIKEL